MESDSGAGEIGNDPGIDPFTGSFQSLETRFWKVFLASKARVRRAR
jgi:hypothetical protein